MPLQNRVLPTGQITDHPFRGTLMGNRGILHDAAQTLKTRRWTHPHWVTCLLTYNDWHRPVMMPHTYTELFFLDEPTALAAGHRPCGLCRRADYLNWRTRWARVHGRNSLSHDDRLLHAARVTRTRQHIRLRADITTLPDGVYIWHRSAPWLVWGAQLLRNAGATYDAQAPRPHVGNATVLTPAPTVATLKQGYLPTLHPSAAHLIAQG